MEKKTISKILVQAHLTNEENEILASWPAEEIHFNKDGKRTLYKEWRSDGMLETYYENEFNDKGQLIKATSFLDEDEINETTLNAYSDDGKLKSYEIQYQDGSSSIFNLNILSENEKLWNIKDEDGEPEGSISEKFDGNGNLIEKIVEEDGNESSRELYKYDDNQNMIEHQLFEYGDLHRTRQNWYNDQNQVVISKEFSPGGSLLSSREMEYTPEGKIAKEIYSNDVEVHYEYNEKGQLTSVRQIQSSNGLNIGYLENHYNEDGEIKEKNIYDMGSSYSVEPGVVGRMASTIQKEIYEYEYFES